MEGMRNRAYIAGILAGVACGVIILVIMKFTLGIL